MYLPSFFESGLPEKPVADESRFDHDLKINEGYQAFASELLRLALLAVAGLSAVWLKLYIPDAGGHGHPANLASHLELSFAFFVLSACTALVDKYFAAKGLELHLKLTRKRIRNSNGAAPINSPEVRKLEKQRDRQYLYSVILLWASILTLVAGVVVFGFAMRTLM
jgi:hypothetical protein